MTGEDSWDGILTTKSGVVGDTAGEKDGLDHAMACQPC